MRSQSSGPAGRMSGAALTASRIRAARAGRNRSLNWPRRDGIGAIEPDRRFTHERGMARLRYLEGREAGMLARVLQRLYRSQLGRELNPTKVYARVPRALLWSFFSNA